MPTVKAWLHHVEVAKTMVQDNCNCANESESMHVLTEENVIAQLQHLRTHPSVASRMASGHLFIHGWVYDIETSADQGLRRRQRRLPAAGRDQPDPERNAQSAVLTGMIGRERASLAMASTRSVS
jgi:carbonic anhydrase